jgi:hypothetical protein
MLLVQKSENIMTGKCPIIYLDTQDYSRFGGIIEGRGTPQDQSLFERLVAMAEAGDAIFACSMPIIFELFSFDRTLPHITEAKAEAVERLCRGHALAYGGDVIALDIAKSAERLKLMPPTQHRTLLTNDYGWTPDIGPVFGALPKITDKKIIAEAVKSVNNTYGLPYDDTMEVLEEYISGKISSSEISSRLISSISSPKQFVRTYCQGFGVESELPDWMASGGKNLIQLFTALSAIVAVCPPSNSEERRMLGDMLKEQSMNAAVTLLDVGSDSLAKYGVSREVFENIRQDPSSSKGVEFVHILGRLLASYSFQITGLSGPIARVETSVTGDIMHSIYLPHVDLWRGDKRFGHLVESAIPEYAGKVVRNRGDLVSRIETFHRGHEGKLS